MSSSDILCTVCGKSFVSGEKWNSHILDTTHLEIAREKRSKTPRWWLDTKWKETCLVVFSSAPVTLEDAAEIIAKLSTSVHGRIIDFIRFGDKPSKKVALLQLESRYMARSIWEEFIRLSENSNTMVIGQKGNQILLKQVVDYVTLEWNHLITYHLGSSDPSKDPKVYKDKPKTDYSSLKDFDWVADTVTYSEHDLTKLRKLLKKLKKSVKWKNSEAIVVQNQLGLRCVNNQNAVVIYGLLEESSQVKLFHAKEIQDALATAFPSRFVSTNVLPLGIQIFRGPPTVELAQVSRLIAHFCKFDTRLRAVLTLVTFWTNYHQIHVKEVCEKEDRLCLGPHALHLLVILFFASENLIPSPKQLTAKENDSFVIRGVDYGFNADEKFRKAWKKDNPSIPVGTIEWKESVVQLTYEIFYFYSVTVSKGSWLLNLHEGLVLKRTVDQGQRKIFVNHVFNPALKTQLALDEWEYIAPIMENTMMALEDHMSGTGKLSLADALAGGKVDVKTVQDWENTCPVHNWSGNAEDLTNLSKCRWWVDKNLKDSSLILYSSDPINLPTAMEVTAMFSSKAPNQVKEFAYYCEKAQGPCVLLFKSRSFASQFWRDVGGAKACKGFVMDGKPVFFKRASEYLDLEMEQLLPHSWMESAEVLQAEVKVEPATDGNPPSLELHCSVCELTFQYGKSGSKHLLDKFHQEAAREARKPWLLLDKSLKECCLVIFSNTPFTLGVVVEYITQCSNPVCSYLTDVFWLDEPPTKVVVLVFRTSPTASEAWRNFRSGMDKNQFLNRIQIKPAVNYIELEWCQLLYKITQCTSSPSKRLSPEVQVNYNSVVGMPCQTNEEMDYKWISDCVTYSQQDLKSLNALVNFVKNIDDKRIAKVDLLRNHYLGLRSADQEIDISVQILGKKKKPMQVTSRTLDETTAVKITDALTQDLLMTVNNTNKIVPKGINFQSLLAIPQFNINILEGDHLIELHNVCGLVARLCQINSQLLSVIKLVTFWANYHKISWGLLSNEGRIPHPVGLHLFVALYFMQEGLIPTSKELSPFKNKPVDLQDVISSKEETQEPLEGIADRIKSIVKLTRDIFQFYSVTTAEGCWLLNLHEGIVLSPEELLQRRHAKGDPWPVTKDTSARLLFITHPFQPERKFTVAMPYWDNTVSPSMKTTVIHLNSYLAGGVVTLADSLVGETVDKKTVEGFLNKCPLKNRNLLEATYEKFKSQDPSDWWWLLKNHRSSCLVLFTSGPITPSFAGQILVEFSSQFSAKLKDLVWWNGSCGIAVLQFEISSVANRIWRQFSTGIEASLNIQGKRVHLKLAMDYEDGELWAMLPRESPFHLTALRFNAINVNSDTRRKNFNWISPLVNCSKQSKEKLRALTDKLNDVFDDSDIKVLLDCDTIALTCHPTMINISVSTVQGKICKDFRTKLMENLTNTFNITERKCGEEENLYLTSSHPVHPLHVNILFDPDHLEIAQMYRLIDYLCKFDTRLRPVLELATFWSTYHKIKFNAAFCRPCPDALIMQLLTVLFFMNEGLIPSTVDVLRRVHTPLIINDEYGAVDCGFAADGVFVEEWTAAHPLPPEEESDTWIENVVQLTREFFLFFSGQVVKGLCVWSTHDGVLLPYKKALERAKETGEDWPKPEGDAAQIPPDARVFLTHPFNRTWSLSFSARNWNKLASSIVKKTGVLLGEYLIGEKMTLGDALAGGVLDSAQVLEWGFNCPLRHWEAKSQPVKPSLTLAGREKNSPKMKPISGKGGVLPSRPSQKIREGIQGKKIQIRKKPESFMEQSSSGTCNAYFASLDLRVDAILVFELFRCHLTGYFYILMKIIKPRGFR